MGDADGPTVAKHVYKALFEGDMLEADIIPYALDAAVQELRSRKLPASRWATFIHMGA
jgi:hypothetical protein